MRREFTTGVWVILVGVVTHYPVRIITTRPFYSTTTEKSFTMFGGETGRWEEAFLEDTVQRSTGT